MEITFIFIKGLLMVEIDSKKFIESLNKVAKTHDGKIVLAFLKDACAWDKTFISNENTELTQYYATRRGVYGALREHIQQEFLKEIEFNFKVKAVDDGKNRNKKDRRETN